MNKIIYWITILFLFIILLIVNANITELDDKQTNIFDITSPVYKSMHSDTLIYNQEGSLNYRLITQYTEYASKQCLWLLTKPILITYNKNKIPTWSIKSDLAKLTGNNILYLYSHVEIKSLTANSQLRKITTNNAQINLTTQDIISQDLVSLYGTTFNSSGLKMYGNLCSKNARLVGKIRALYEIQKK